MRQPVDAMEVHFSDHELRDLKKEQRLRREEKEARESKINALLGLAEETIREERSGIDAHGRRYKAPPRTYSRAESTYCAAAPAPAPAPAPRLASPAAFLPDVPSWPTGDAAAPAAPPPGVAAAAPPPPPAGGPKKLPSKPRGRKPDAPAAPAGVILPLID